MRIAMIGQKGIPAKEGGVEKHVEALALALAKNGHEVIVYTRPHYTPKTKKTHQGVALVSLPSFKTKHLDTASHTFLASVHLLFQKIDIVHYHGIGPALFLWIPRIFCPRIKIVSTIHCQDYYHQKWGFLARFLLKSGERIAMHFAHKTIAVSESLTDYIQKTYNRKPTYIPNGIYLPLKNNNTRESLKWWELKPKEYILAVSRLVRHKGIHALIAAYQKLENPPKKLVIVGAPAFTQSYETALKKLANNNPKIIFTGQQTGKTLSILYQNAYLFVQPSESEGLSIALLEAVSYGLPVIASNIPANKEIIGEGGIIFQNKNVLDLKDKLEKALNLPDILLQKKSIGLQKEIIKKYAWQKVAQATENLYQGLVSQKTGIPLGFKTKKA